MEGEAGEQTPQRPKLISTGYLDRSKSFWRFEGSGSTARVPMGCESQQARQHMAVVEALEALGLDKVHREAWDGEEDEDAFGAELECRGCKKIWKVEGQRHDLSNVVRLVYDTGEC